MLNHQRCNWIHTRDIWMLRWLVINLWRPIDNYTFFSCPKKMDSNRRESSEFTALIWIGNSRFESFNNKIGHQWQPSSTCRCAMRTHNSSENSQKCVIDSKSRREESFAARTIEIEKEASKFLSSKLDFKNRSSVGEEIVQNGKQKTGCDNVEIVHEKPLSSHFSMLVGHWRLDHVESESGARR